ncbi:MAG: hypothetical protein AB1467_04375 [Candidatus Diapherotrites archaeon]
MPVHKGIISSFNQFRTAAGKIDLSSNNERVEALNRYFEQGGFVSILPNSSGWPKLTYPSKHRIKEMLQQLNEKKDLFSRKHGDWQQKHFQAKTYKMFTKLKKFADRTYWDHTIKSIKDKSYRNEAQKVKLPTHLVADPKFKPMIKMFVNDPEYRRQLIETIEHSIVYRDRKELGRYANFLQEFRKNISEDKMKEIKEKLKEIDSDIKMYNALQKWSEE